mgnify:FL=1
MYTIKKIWKNRKNIIPFFQGWYRYKIYYSSGPLRFLMRSHIRSQIDVRIESMDRECYNSGACKKCGCATTALQMANKSCEGFCYPSMMNKSQWEYAVKNARIIKDSKSGVYWKLTNVSKFEDGMFKIVLKFL